MTNLRSQRGPAPRSAAAFAHRFALRQFPDASLLVDFRSGMVYRLNPLAVQICEARGQGCSAPKIAHDLAQSFGIDERRAKRHVTKLLAELDQRPPRASPKPLSFGRDAAGFVLRWHGHSVLHIGGAGRSIRLLGDLRLLRLDVAACLRWATPHLLALHHQPVLHASAVRCTGGVRAISGASGAGKTTLARLLARHGASRIAEDLVAIRVRAGVPVVAADFETRLRSWVEDRSRQLAALRLMKVSARELREMVGGPAEPLVGVWFLDCTRRSGERLTAQHTTASEAAVLLLENGFAELGVRYAWAELLEVAAVAAQSVPVARVRVPHGLKALGKAVRAYKQRLRPHEPG